MTERVKLAMFLEHFVRKIKHAIEKAIEVRVRHLPHTVPRLGASLPKHGVSVEMDFEGGQMAATSPKTPLRASTQIDDHAVGNDTRSSASRKIDEHGAKTGVPASRDCPVSADQLLSFLSLPECGL